MSSTSPGDGMNLGMGMVKNHGFLENCRLISWDGMDGMNMDESWDFRIVDGF